MTAAPQVRIVNALNGEITAPPTKFMQALSEADHFCAELAERHELAMRVEELSGEVDMLAGELELANRHLEAARAQVAKADRVGWR